MDQDNVSISEESSSSRIHPLLIDHVVEKVLEHFVKKSTSKSLLDSRLVCKTWSKTSTEILKRLESSEEVRFAFGDTDRMTRFLHAMKNTTNLPYQKFGFDVNFFIQENEKLFPKFIWTCSPFIRDLSLSFGKNFQMSLFPPHKYQNVDFRNLTCLNFKCTYLNTMTNLGNRNMWQSDNPHSSKQYDGLVRLLELILESAPNLQELDFCIPTGHLCNEDNIKFGNLLANSIPSKVKKLKLILEIQKEQLEKLQMRDLKLEILHMNLYGSSLENEWILNFINNQKTTLKFLNIADLEKQFAEDLDYPSLKNLNILEIKGGNQSNFAYLKSFPSLEKLILRNGRNHGLNNNSATDKENQELCFPSVKELVLTYEGASSTLIQRFSRIFPNLKKLQIQIGADSISALESVFELMPGLEQLDIGFPNFFANLAVDTVFTGIPIEVCREMLEKQSFTLGDLDIGHISRKPNISGLNKLKKLSITAESYAIVVTNVTAIFGLLENPSLEELEIEQFSISREYFRRLMDRFKVQEEPVKKHAFSYKSLFQLQ